MKYTKKLLSLVLVLVLALALAVPGFAAQTGDLTINGTTQGKKYDLYKVFDLTQAGDNYSYTVNEHFEAFFESYEAYQKWLALEENTGKTPIDYVGTFSDNDANIGALADELLAYAVANKATIAPIEVTGAAGTSTTVNNLEYGYYLLNVLGATETASGYYSMFALNTLSGNDTTITVKGTYPTVDKTVSGGQNNSTGTNVNEASVGDELTFTLSAKVPDMTGFPSYTFRMKDTMSKGLTYKGITEVKIGNGEPLTLGDAYTAHTASGEDGSTVLTIEFVNFIQYADQQGADITVKYKAEINENAIAGVTADNKVKIEYSNDPKNPNSVNGVTAEADTKTYTTSLTINKVDGDNHPLTGAAFRITGEGVNMVVTTGDVYVVSEKGTYYKLLNGTYTTEEPTPETEGLYEDTDTMYELKTNAVLDTEEGTSETVNAEAFVNANGTLKFDGLGAGTYTISEVVVPNGYNAIEDFDVTITFDYATQTFSATATNGQQVNQNGPFSMTIVNQSGTELPSTGGMGTTIFYTLGGVLVVGAAILLVTKKRVHDVEG